MIEQAVGPGGLRTSRTGGIEISVVLPCLNEALTLEACIVQARAAMDGMRASGEVIVADNGSTDGSQRIAESAGAKVVHVAAKGYGSALMGGIDAARGRYVVMGDADSSYDFGDIPALVEKLEEGYDLVVGNRFEGGIMPGAMPWLHRWIGNPVLSGVGRLLFPSCIGDFHCGLRGFTKEAYGRMKLRCTGMEFSGEMVIRSALLGMRIGEVPTVLRPDGRGRRPHLRTWRDGWRNLRLMLLFRPEGMLERLHERVVVPRRRAVLARHVAAVIPQGVQVLDVGCGDGTLTREIMDLRPDLTVEGMEVVCRSQGGFPVTAYDGRKLPCENQSVDVVLFIDVLHHADDPLGLLREACRVSRRAIVIKDHLRDGFLAGQTLRLMDWIGNRRHGVALPYNYWSRAEWDAAFESCELEIANWLDHLTLYPRPASWVFQRRLHFLATLVLSTAREAR